jgi:hypothetical protein
MEINLRRGPASASASLADRVDRRGMVGRPGAGIGLPSDSKVEPWLVPAPPCRFPKIRPPLGRHARGARLAAPLAGIHGAGMLTLALWRIEILLDFARRDLHNFYGIRYSVSGALFAFGAFWHRLQILMLCVKHMG